jgi:hypothetical protein
MYRQEAQQKRKGESETVLIFLYKKISTCIFYFRRGIALIQMNRRGC